VAKPAAKPVKKDEDAVCRVADSFAPADPKGGECKPGDKNCADTFGNQRQCKEGDKDCVDQWDQPQCKGPNCADKFNPDPKERPGKGKNPDDFEHTKEGGAQCVMQNGKIDPKCRPADSFHPDGDGDCKPGDKSCADNYHGHDHGGEGCKPGDKGCADSFEPEGVETCKPGEKCGSADNFDPKGGEGCKPGDKGCADAYNPDPITIEGGCRGLGQQSLS